METKYEQEVTVDSWASIIIITIIIMIINIIIPIRIPNNWDVYRVTERKLDMEEFGDNVIDMK